MEEATAFANRIAKEKDDEDLAKVRAAGTTEVYVPTRAERLELKQALLPVHRLMEARIGKQLIEDIYAVTSFHPNKM